MTASRYVRRPRVGERIETGRYGPADVTAVYDHGRTLIVATRAHGACAITRADAGWWLRVTG